MTAGTTGRLAYLTAGLVSVAFTLACGTARAVERQPAPAFSIRDLTGNEIDLEALTGKGPVLLDFFATWCKPCVASLPELDALYRRFGPAGLTIVGVSIDGPRNFAKVRPFVARTGITYPVVIDTDGRLQRDYHVTALPTAVLIDSGGAIVSIHQGYRPGEERMLRDEIRELLPSEADSSAAPADTSGGASP